jgi:NAD-reducing hydrogenase small subunit
MAEKIRVATASLCGCFGCHMSFLDIDERILELVELVEFDRTPITDIKTLGDCDLGLIEGGVANAENVEVLREFRRHCKVLVAVGACAVNGGIPAMRNQWSLKECLEESYVGGVGVTTRASPTTRRSRSCSTRSIPSTRW